MKEIFSRVRVNRKEAGLVLLFMLVSAGCTMALPTLLASMIDKGISGQNHSFITTIGIVMAVLSVVACVCSVIATTLSARVSTRFSADLRAAVFKQVQDFSAAEMDKFGTASLVTRSVSDITNVQDFLTMVLRAGLLAPLMAIAGLVLSSLSGGRISSVLIVAVPVLLPLTGIIVFFVTRYSTLMRKKVDKINRLFLETLSGVRVIRAFNKQGYEMKRFGSANEEYARIAVESGRVGGLMMPVIQVVFGVTTAAVMAMGASFVSQGTLEVGALVANAQYITMILMAVMMFSMVITMFPMAYACAKRIAEVLETENSIKDGSASLSERKQKGTVVFDNVTFSYPGGDEPIIQNISFEAHPGEVTAIIGKTGCGKSTILKLIPRLYDPSSGHVLVDGMDVRDYKVDELRSLIGFVPQNEMLFSGDIASNLNWGNPNGTEADWKRAAKIACADEFIEKKDGTFHAPIDQGSTNVSGGQRQRISIARAVMKKPEIYVLDDSFSALDNTTNKQVRANLKQVAGDQATIIMVVERIGSILDADRILVLDEGKIISSGTHEELLKTCPLYKEIATLQLGEEVVNHVSKQ